MRRNKWPRVCVLIALVLSATLASSKSVPPLNQPPKSSRSPNSVRDVALNSTRVQITRVTKSPDLDAPLVPHVIGESLRTANSSTEAPVRVNSKTGRAIARMQGKRQADASGFSRRNEDPWFLDSPPYPLQPYRFVYNVKGKNGQTEQYRQEVGDGKFLTGSYGYVLPDGIYRHVDYVADDRGFRAYIRTSEPGTANQNPANVVIESNPVPVIPGVDYALPNPLDAAARSPAGAYDYRPPGSIVGTPARNFSSLGLAPSLDRLAPSPVIRSNPIGGSFGPAPVRDPLTGYNVTLPFGSPLGYLPPPQPYVPTSTWSGSQTSVDDALFSRIKPLTSSADLNRTGESFGSIAPRLPTAASDPLPPLSATYPRYLEPNNILRSGPGVLSYDLPLSNQGELTPGKLTYDVNNHLVGLNQSDWNRLALLRAQHITNSTLWSPHLNPLIRDDSFGTLAPLNFVSSGHQVISGSSSSENSRDSFRRSEHETLGPDFNKVTVSKEHRSGFRNNSGRDYELHRDLNAPTPADPLLPPPAPVFLPRTQPAHQDGTKGVSRISRLDYLEPALRQQQQLDDQQQVAAATTTQAPELELPQKSVEDSYGGSTKSGPVPTSLGDFLPATMSPQFGPVGVKGAHWTASSPTRDSIGTTTRLPPSPGARPVRMSQDYRSSMMMNDLRSMQNALGLPQPPRLRRLESPVPSLHDERLDAGLNLADKIVTSRLNHVDALLRAGPDGPSSRAALSLSVPPPPPLPVPHELRPIASGGLAASSVEPSVALNNEVDRPSSVKTSTTKRVLVDEAGASRPLTKRKTNSGSVSKLESFKQLGDATGGGLNFFDSLGPSNETFEAQRLVKAAKLQAEKVSELEKFQQRLRTQKLLLEQLKNQDKLANRTSPAYPRTHTLNSHVKYDDANDGENAIDSLRLLPKSQADTHLGRDYLRSRRQNDAEPPSSLPPSSTTTTTTARPLTTTAKPTTGHPKKLDTSKVNATTLRMLSDLAHQIQQWPSLAQSLNKTQPAPPSQNSASTVDSGRGLKPTIGRNATTERKANNTINLDFINSVTALSVDQLNPFAMSSVNPAIQRSSSGSRLQPHRLESPGVGPVGIAIANARYSSSPELLAAVGLSEKTSGNSDSNSNPGGWASNHRFGATGSSASPAPYVMTGLSSNNDIVQSAPSGHRQSGADKDARVTSSPEVRSETSLVHGQMTNRRSMQDGFNIRDNAIEIGHHKFFEVVSNARQPAETSQFQAFTDPQLSISAVSRRRRRETDDGHRK